MYQCIYTTTTPPRPPTSPPLLALHDNRGHVETIRTLVKRGHADVNHETRSGKTPLIEAAR